MPNELLSLFLLSCVLLGSPGPAPLAIASTSASFGIKKTLAFFFGILFGLFLVIILTAFGLGKLLEASPKLSIVLKIFSFIYILYLAYKIGFKEKKITQQALPPSFSEGFILSITNPKAYAVLLSIFSSTSISASSGFNIAPIIACMTAGFVVDISWLSAGGLLQKLFADPKTEKIISKIFALLIVLSVGYSLIR